MDDPSGPLGGAGPSPEPPDLPDTRSYAERYRGTPWGTAEPVPVAGPTAVRRRGRGFLWLGVLLLLGSIVAGVGLAVTGGFDGLSGRGPAATDTLPGAPAATTDPLAASAVIDEFLGLIANPRLTFNVRVTSVVTSDTTVAKVTLVGKVAGADADFRMTESSDGVAFGGRIILKGATVWVLLDGHTEWLQGSLEPDQLPNTDTFDSIHRTEDLVYVDRVMRRGFLAHHLATAEGWRPDDNSQLVAAGVRIDSASMDIWVLEGGRPIEVRYVANVSHGGLGQTGIGAATAVAEATYVFSDVNSRITINAPR